MIEAIAHRGSHAQLAENSAAAILQAIHDGADGVEIDVHRTLDDVIVVHHDYYPRGRCANESLRARPIVSLTYDELRQFDIGNGSRIPPLAGVLDAVEARTRLYIEMKGAGVAEALGVLLAEEDPGWLALHSFDHRVVTKMAELLPNVPRGILQGSYLLDNCAPLRGAAARDLWQHMELIDTALVAEAHDCGSRVIAWTANDPRDWERLAGLGVDAICTDTIPEFVRWRAGQGA